MVALCAGAACVRVCVYACALVRAFVHVEFVHVHVSLIHSLQAHIDLFVYFTLHQTEGMQRMLPTTFCLRSLITFSPTESGSAVEVDGLGPVYGWHTGRSNRSRIRPSDTSTRETADGQAHTDILRQRYLCAHTM